MLRRVWVALVLVACGNDVGDEPPPRSVPLPARVRLLTEAQYANAVRDLLGDVRVPPRRQPGTLPHQLVHEDVLAVDGPLLVQFRIAAETIAAEVAASAAPLGCEDEACTGAVADPAATAAGGFGAGVAARIDAFAARAFRRPLDPAESASLWQLYLRGRDRGPAAPGGETAARAGGLALVVEAVLQAPSFVYRTELGPSAGTEPSAPGAAAPAAGVVELTPHELAAELSFLLADSLPDAALWGAAEDGSLLREATLAAHVERLLATPRVQAHLTDVVLRWLGAYAILDARKDPARGELSQALRDSMLAETRLFVDDVLWHRGGSLRELLTSSETFVDGALAAHYGHPEATASPTHVRATLPASERGGVLTHASLLASLATEQRESIIRRGMFVHSKLLCSPELGRPPFDAIAATARFTQAMSEAQLSYFRTAHVYCSSCHAAIDPPGRALHRYDGLGRYRELDDNEQPIESDGRIAIGGEPRRFADAIGLGRELAASAHVARCVVDQLAHHALGRDAGPALRGYLHRRFEDAGRDLVEVFRALATSPQFRLRRGPR